MPEEIVYLEHERVHLLLDVSVFQVGGRVVGVQELVQKGFPLLHACRNVNKSIVWSSSTNF